MEMLTTTQGKLSDKFSLGYNGTINKTKFREEGKFLEGRSWWGSALYLNVDPAPWFGLTLREEYFSDKNGLKVFTSPLMNSGNIFATTLSANFRVNSFIIIPEFRVDKASKDIFTAKDATAKGSNPSVLVAAIYQF